MIHISTILEVCTKETFNLIHSGSRVREMYAFITTGCPNLQTKKKKNEKWKQNKTTNMLRIVSIIRHRAADTTRKMQMRLVISLILFLSFCCVLCRFFFSLSLSLFFGRKVWWCLAVGYTHYTYVYNLVICKFASFRPKKWDWTAHTAAVYLSSKYFLRV